MDERKEPTEQTAQSEKELHRGHRERMLQTYLKNMQNAAVYYDAENEPAYGDEILTLSTCNYHVTDGRLALIAVRIGN